VRRLFLCRSGRIPKMPINGCVIVHKPAPLRMNVFVAITGSVGNLPYAENMDIQYAQAAIFSPAIFHSRMTPYWRKQRPNTEMTLITDVNFGFIKTRCARAAQSVISQTDASTCTVWSGYKRFALIHNVNRAYSCPTNRTKNSNT